MKQKPLLLLSGQKFVLFLLSYCCVLFCFLLNFQLKLRSHCRLLVFCFLWASCVAFYLYGVALVYFLFFLNPRSDYCSAKFLRLKVECHVLLGSFFLSWFHSGSVVSLSLENVSHCHCCLSVCRSPAPSLSDGVWFALLNSVPSPPFVALLTNSRSPLHAEPP